MQNLELYHRNNFVKFDRVTILAKRIFAYLLHRVMVLIIIYMSTYCGSTALIRYSKQLRDCCVERYSLDRIKFVLLIKKVEASCLHVFNENRKLHIKREIFKTLNMGNGVESLAFYKLIYMRMKLFFFILLETKSHISFCFRYHDPT